MYFLNKVGRIKSGGMGKEIEKSVICETINRDSYVVTTKIKKNGLPNMGRSK